MHEAFSNKLFWYLNYSGIHVHIISLIYFIEIEWYLSLIEQSI